MAKQTEYKNPSPLHVGIFACCPQCGKGKLYSGILMPAIECNVCELDYGFIDSGDGPAVFVILIIGFVITGLAMFVQNNFSPPWWVHVMLWLPTIIIASIWALRFAKSIMIALQFKTNAEQAVLNRENM